VDSTAIAAEVVAGVFQMVVHHQKLGLLLHGLKAAL
jgi:hypothetical protein